LWRAEYISTAVLNKLQAEFATAPAAEEGKNAAQLFFLRFLCSERSSHRFLLFLKVPLI
jgi:hypothetical protein